MAQVFFISDLHLGHKKIKEFEPTFRSGKDCLENMEIIIKNWNSVVSKRDLVYVLGDVAFSEYAFGRLGELAGRKILVRGNHDNYFKTEDWLKHFESVEGLMRYKYFWLSHCPLHPDELRGKKNIHGHVHSHSIRLGNGEYDPNYINVSCEAVGETPIAFDLIRSGEYQKIRKC